MFSPITWRSLVSVVIGVGCLLWSPVVAQDGPPEDLGTVLASQRNLSTYYNLIKKYPEILLQLPSAEGVTIIAPSNAAFDNIPFTPLNGVWDADNQTTIALLQYHILQGILSASTIEAGPSILRSSLLTSRAWTNVTSGQNVLVQKQPSNELVLVSSLGTRVSVTKADIAFAGGIIQMIDNLMIPPARLEKTAEAFRFMSFLGGLYAAEAMPAAAERQNVTLFVPRNEAMQLVGGSLASLSKDDLVRTMNYHLVPGRVLSASSLVNDSSLSTAAGAGSDIRVQKTGNDVFVNAARVVQPDILVANGVVHIIDNVLNPAATGVMPDPTLATQPPAFGPASVADLPFTTALPCTVDCPVTTTARTSTRPTTTGLGATSRGGAVAPRCTGVVVAAAAAGMLGLGLAL